MIVGYYLHLTHFWLRLSTNGSLICCATYSILRDCMARWYELNFAPASVHSNPSSAWISSCRFLALLWKFPTFSRNLPKIAFVRVWYCLQRIQTDTTIFNTMLTADQSAHVICLPHDFTQQHVLKAFDCARIATLDTIERLEGFKEIRVSSPCSRLLR